MTPDPQELLVVAEKLHKPMEVYYKWKTICDRYDRGKSAKLAQIQTSIKQEGSHSQLQTLALASEEWQKYLDEFHEAEKNMVKARIEYDSLKARFDALQSVLAFLRDSMKRLGG